MIVLDLLDVKITCWGGICHRARLRDHYVLYENVVNFKNKHLSTIICSVWNDMVEGQKNNYINKNSYNIKKYRSRSLKYWILNFKNYYHIYLWSCHQQCRVSSWTWTSAPFFRKQCSGFKLKSIFSSRCCIITTQQALGRSRPTLTSNLTKIRENNNIKN